MIEASNDPDIIANNYVSEIFHPDLNKKIKIHGSPWKFSETPTNFGLAPKLGEHNKEILTSIGYSNEQIQKLQDNQII